MNENMGKDKLSAAEEPSNQETKPVQKQQMRKQLIKLMALVVGAIIVLLVVIFIIHLVKGGTKSYQQVETELKKAAMQYYKVQNSLLPTEEGASDQVDDTVLVASDYMKPLDKLRKDENCTGKVVVEKINGAYVYTPYLTCGNKYVTKEVYKAVLENGTVTSSNGLYEMNNEYVFRGEYVNNYIQLGESLFRIVKVTANHELLLISNEVNDVSYAWDDRFNNDRNYQSGINDYRVSRLYDYLRTFYKSGGEGKITITEAVKEKLTSFSLCVGKRGAEETNNSGAVECQDTLENQMIGVLTASDFINASIDSNCLSLASHSCQNYNYLAAVDSSWWLLTAEQENSYKAFYVNESGYSEAAVSANSKRIRPVVMLSKRAMIKSGNGTIKTPYILK